MPTLSRWFIRTALCCFVSALLIGVLTQSPTLRLRWPLLTTAWLAYVHLLTVGWITGLIMGVALWLFPRPDPRRPPPPVWLGWTTFAVLNVGLLLRIGIEPVTLLHPGTPLRVALPVAGLLQVLGAIGFALLIWPRIRER